ncbi:glycoside hydrolase domain-containing protein [Clostridium perfringens]|uniref:glycoside hydrolase domain-containing protein n=1 Tax=Clostridium perfringens TaxID=1502 RepID=UPI003D7DEECF
MSILKSKLTKVLSHSLTLIMCCSLFPMGTLQTKAKDRDNSSETEEVTTIIDDSETGTNLNQFNFSEGWIADRASVDYNETEHWTNKNQWINEKAPSFELKFKGTKIELYGKKDNDLGIYAISIDDNEPIEIDAYNLDAQNQEKLFEASNLTNEEHVLRFQILDKRNPMANDSKPLGAQIDFAKVYSTEIVNPNKEYATMVKDHTIGDDLFNFTYSDGWRESTGVNSLYNGDEFWTLATEDLEPSYTLKFYGNKVELYGVKESSSAICEVTIDNGEPEEFDPYSPTRLTGQKLYEKDGLSHGEHTITVKVTHRKNPSSTSYNGEIDYAKVYHKKIPATGIVFDTEGIQIENGMSDSVNAIVTPSYATEKTIIYSIEDENIATIDETGEITTLNEGETNIIATVKGTNISSTIPLRVTKAGALLGASVGSTDFHYLQKNYNEIKKLNLNSWSDIAWIGDELNSKIVTWTKSSPVNNVLISSSDFINENGDLISSDNVEISWLKETLANIGRGNPSAPVEPFPDIIHNSGSLDIEENKVASAWINIKIPRNAKPGIYNGSIVVTADELEEPYTFDYSFEVLNLVQPLPKETNTQIELWQHPYTTARYYGVAEEDLFTEKHFEYLKDNLEEYRDMGGRGVIANIVEEAWNHQSYDSDPSMIKWIKKSNGTFEFDYTHFDKWIQFNVDLGILDPEKGFGQIKCYSIVPWNNRIQYFNETTNRNESINPRPGSELWINTWTQFLTSFMSHLEEKGWFNITYISMDERSMDDLKASVDLIESITNQSGEHFKISSAMNYQSGNDYSFLDRIDDISIGLSHINHNSDDMKNMAAHRQELGLLTTIYTCTGDYPNSFTISDTAESAWTMWYSLAQNTDGFMRWSWDGWVENPLENVSYKYWEPGDPWFIYPAEKDSKTNTFYSTPRLERLKEGIRDINKAKYLMKNAPELKDDIDSLVKSLKRPNKGGNGYGSAVAASQEDRDLTISEVNRMKDGINKFAKEFISSKNENIVASPVRNFQPLEINKNNVSVAWQAPENTNGLEGYILYKDGKKIKELDSKENTYKFKGLNRHTIYNFKIAAKYSNGEISKKESITLRTTR